MTSYETMNRISTQTWRRAAWVVLAGLVLLVYLHSENLFATGYTVVAAMLAYALGDGLFSR